MPLGIKTMIFPRRFVLGPGVLGISGKQIVIYTKKPLIMGGRRALDAIRKAGLQSSLEKEGVKYAEARFGEGVPYGPECCEPEIERLTKIGKEKGCDGVIAAGGGKCIDAGKAVAKNLGGEIVIIPTIAATDAPTSALSVIYTPDHVFKEYWFYDYNPAAVIVDSKVIATAPARYLAGGMGDAASKKFEAEACVNSGAKILAIKPDWIGGLTHLALLIGRAQYEVMLRYGELAMESVRMGIASPALEAIAETNILFSGLSFESCGLAAAHSVHNGITLLEHQIPEENRPIHGELVNFGACVEMFMEDRPTEDIRRHFVWSHKVGLPLTFQEIGFKPGEPTDEQLWKAAEKACAAGETIHVMYVHGAKELGAYKNPSNLAETVYTCMKAVDQLGKTVSKEYPRASYEAKWVPYDAFVRKH